MPDERCRCDCVNTFSTKEARHDLRRYRRDGPDATTRALIDAIRSEGVAGATLLDIGGGIGAIQLELLEAGVASTESVDASEAYVAVATAEAQRRGIADRTSHRFGTLAELRGEVGEADIVTLDKVVCCNADLPALLDDVVLRARRMVGLIYPRETWWNRLFAHGVALLGWLTRDTTRWYLHPHAEIDRLLGAAGFERREVSRSFVWLVALYVRPADQATGSPSS